MSILPVNRKCFVHLNVLACLNTSTAQNALLRVITIEGIAMVLFIGLGMIWNRLMFDGQQLFRVVDRTVSVVVVAHCAIQNVVAKDAIKCFPLSGAGPL
jgi:hypothetical protein